VKSRDVEQLYLDEEYQFPSDVSAALCSMILRKTAKDRSPILIRGRQRNDPIQEMVVMRALVVHIQLVGTEA